MAENIQDGIGSAYPWQINNYNSGKVYLSLGSSDIGSNTPMPIYQPEITSTNIHTGSKEIQVYMQNHICSNNTTTDSIVANGSYTGEWQYVLDYNEIRVSVIADAPSATNGLAIQWSANGSSIITGVDDNFTIASGLGKTFSTPRNWPYFRVNYTNGSTNQSSFFLMSQVDRMASKGSMHKIQDAIVTDDDAILTKSVFTGEGDDGTFRNVGVSISNRLMTVSQPYGYAVSEGDIANHTQILKFGTRTSVAAGTPSLIWEGTAAQYTYLTSAEQLKVASTDNVNDNVGGTGALTLTLVGLDANYDELTEIITMTGTTVVTTNASFIRIFRAYVTTSGTSYTNTGTITVTNNAGAVELLKINIGDSQTLMTMWTVPRNTSLFITGGTFSTDSNKGARVSLFTRQLDGGILYPWRIRYRAYIFSGNENFPFAIPFVLPEKTDIEVRVQTPLSAGVTSCGATFEGWYETGLA